MPPEPEIICFPQKGEKTTAGRSTLGGTIGVRDFTSDDDRCGQRGTHLDHTEGPGNAVDSRHIVDVRLWDIPAVAGDGGAPGLRGGDSEAVRLGDVIHLFLPPTSVVTTGVPSPPQRPLTPSLEFDQRHSLDFDEFDHYTRLWVLKFYSSSQQNIGLQLDMPRNTSISLKLENL